MKHLVKKKFGIPVDHRLRETTVNREWQGDVLKKRDCHEYIVMCNNCSALKGLCGNIYVSVNYS